MQDFISAHVNQVKPLLREARLAHWRASVFGDAAEFEKLTKYELKIRQIYSDKKDFALLSEAKNSPVKYDQITNRQIQVLYNLYLENQIDSETLIKIVSLGNEIEKKFGTFRGRIQGRTVTSNEIDEILKSSTDQHLRREAWFASKQVGDQISNEITELIKLRNQSVQQVGYRNYHDLSLTITELDKDELDRIFSDLYDLTQEPFKEVKSEIDDMIAQTYKINPDQIQPWHYHDPFFQEVPHIYDLNLDTFYENQNVKELAVLFYDGIGIDVRTILKNRCMKIQTRI